MAHFDNAQPIVQCLYQIITYHRQFQHLNITNSFTYCTVLTYSSTRDDYLQFWCNNTLRLQEWTVQNNVLAVIHLSADLELMFVLLAETVYS